MSARREIKHGTYSGAQAHRKRGVPMCDDCAEAHRTYMREYRREYRGGSGGGRSDRRHSYAAARTFAELRRLHPGQYRALYDQHADEWERDNAGATP